MYTPRAIKHVETYNPLFDRRSPVAPSKSEPSIVTSIEHRRLPSRRLLPVVLQYLLSRHCHGIA